MKSLYDKFTDKILDMAVGQLTSYVMAWCWNQAGVQEMVRNFDWLLSWTENVNPAAQQRNATNLRVQQLLRQLKDEAQQGKQLLDGEPTASNLSNAKERFEKIIVVTLELKCLLLVNARSSSVHPKIKQPHFKPRYLQRRTKFQVICSCKGKLSSKGFHEQEQPLYICFMEE